MDPAVSVVIPSFNHARYLDEAIESVLVQSFGDLELIVVDDASTDDSWARIEARSDPRVRSVRHPSNRGAHATLNEGLAMARGTYVAILNSDDRFDPQRLERMTAAMNAADAGFAISDIAFIDASGAACPDDPRALDYRRLRDWCRDKPASTWFVAGNPAITTSNFLFRRALMPRAGEFLPLRYTHDWAWALAAALHTRLCWVQEPLLAYRVHPTNTLSEGDHWRHIHENAWIQARAITSLAAIAAAQGDATPDPGAVLPALLCNRSGPPLATLALLVHRCCGGDEGSLLALTRADGSAWYLPALADAADIPADVFASLGQLAGREQALRDRDELIEQRWRTLQDMNRLVAERDRTIADQREMIETRGQTIAKMSGQIAWRDESIAAQARMLEERFAAIQEMGATIHQREQARDAALHELGETRQQLDDCRAALERYRAHPVIRTARALRRLVRGGHDGSP